MTMSSTPVNPLSATVNDVKCKACGASAYRRMAARTPHAGEQRTWTCSLCSDGWTAIIRPINTGKTKGRWIHIPQWTPPLTRTIILDYSPDNFQIDHDDSEWDYFLGKKEITQGKWFKMLDVRRRNLRNRVAQ
jgi:hypothetical protein